MARLAVDKANLGAARIAEKRRWPIVAADTVVVLDDRILGKAERPHEATAMLTALSGRSHWVYTGVAVLSTAGDLKQLVSASRVVIQPLTAEAIKAYVDTGEPLGKAGAYAIQGRAAIFIERLEGSYSGVVGLPLYETAQMLSAMGL